MSTFYIVRNGYDRDIYCRDRARAEAVVKDLGSKDDILEITVSDEDHEMMFPAVWPTDRWERVGFYKRPASGA